VNRKEGKLELKRQQCCLNAVDLVGIDYLWDIILNWYVSQTITLFNSRTFASPVPVKCDYVFNVESQRLCGAVAMTGESAVGRAWARLCLVVCAARPDQRTSQ